MSTLAPSRDFLLNNVRLMKINFFYLAIPLLLLFSACDRRQMPYTFETCSAFFTKNHTVTGTVKPSDKHWKIVEQNLDKDYVVLQYEGDAFTDACVSEANGLQANLSGKYMQLNAYAKVTDNDSFAIPLSKVTSGTDTIWTGSYSSINMQDYFMHYPGRLFPVVYVKVYYDYPVMDINASFAELNKGFKSFTFIPTGKKY